MDEEQLWSLVLVEKNPSHSPWPCILGQTKPLVICRGSCFGYDNHFLSAFI